MLRWLSGPLWSSVHLRQIWKPPLGEITRRPAGNRFIADRVGAEHHRPLRASTRPPTRKVERQVSDQIPAVDVPSYHASPRTFKSGVLTWCNQNSMKKNQSSLLVILLKWPLQSPTSVSHPPAPQSRQLLNLRTALAYDLIEQSYEISSHKHRDFQLLQVLHQSKCRHM